MDKPVLSLGDIFTIGETDYVYLAGTLSITYAAKIATPAEFKSLRDIENRHRRSGSFDIRSTVFSYVALTTESFEKHAALLGDPRAPGANLSNRHLNDEDIEAITKLILEGYVAPDLKKALQRSLGSSEDYRDLGVGLIGHE
jgi:hypothetical protein